jgi:serine/threonine-protein kinase
MSPEQVRNAKRVDHRTDIWALGVLLQELLTGRPPFEASSFSGLCAAIIADPPTPIREDWPEVPPAIEELLARCLEKDPARRLASVHDFAQALAPFARPPPANPPSRPGTRRPCPPPSALRSPPPCPTGAWWAWPLPGGGLPGPRPSATCSRRPSCCPSGPSPSGPASPRRRPCRPPLQHPRSPLRRLSRRSQPHPPARPRRRRFPPCPPPLPRRLPPPRGPRRRPPRRPRG